MIFSNITNSICPFLSIGQKEAVECQNSCMLFNPITCECNLTALRFLNPAAEAAELEAEENSDQ